MRSFLKSHGLFLLILTIITFIAYHNSLTGVFLSDDNNLIANAKNFINLKYILSHDIYLVSSMVPYLIINLGGLSPFNFHLISLFIHLINVWLVYILVVTLSKNKQVSFFTSAIFSIHPLLTESVAWISGMSYPLYTLFLLGSFILFIKFTLEKKSIKHYLLSLLLFLLALLTSIKAIIFPFILVVYYITYIPRKKNWSLIIPYVIFMILLLLLSVAPNIGSRLETARVGQNASMINVLLPPVSLATYIGLLIWPDRLTLHHVDPVTNVMYIYSFILLTLIIIALLFFWKKERILFFWLMFFLISLSLVLTPFPLASFVAERYVYFGSIGLFYLFSWALIRLSQNLKTPSLSWIIITICILLLTIRTIERNNDWQTKHSFWSATSLVSPYSYQAQNNYGLVLLDEGKRKEAGIEFSKTIELKPDYAEGYQNLGFVYQLMGRLPEALGQYEIALHLYQKTKESKPNIGKLYQNLGGLYLSIEQYDKAVFYAQKALTLDPYNSKLLINTGIIYLKKGDKKNAKDLFDSALRTEPNSEKAQYWETLSR